MSIKVLKILRFIPIANLIPIFMLFKGKDGESLPASILFKLIAKCFLGMLLLIIARLIYVFNVDIPILNTVVLVLQIYLSFVWLSHCCISTYEKLQSK